MSSDDDENSRLLPAIPNTSFNYGLVDNFVWFKFLTVVGPL